MSQVDKVESTVLSMLVDLLCMPQVDMHASRVDEAETTMLVKSPQTSYRLSVGVCWWTHHVQHLRP